MALPVLFGRLTFFPSIPEFTRRYPDLVIEVEFHDQPVDLIESGIDIAVQVGELRDSGYLTRVLNRGPRLTAASPAYLSRHGEPLTPADLAGHNCVVGAASGAWSFSENGRAFEVTVRGNLVVTGGDALREAALLDLGIVQSNWWTLSQDIAAGRLKPLLEAYAVEGRPLSVVYPPTRHVPQKLRVMIDYLVEITRLPGAERDRPNNAT